LYRHPPAIEKLSVDERIALVERRLWESIAEATPLIEAQRAELDRRLEDHKRDPGEVVPWESSRRPLLPV
jgi:putative addiction module component (TIGR02574 family)